MKLFEDLRVPVEYDKGRWQDIVRKIQMMVNLLAEERIDAFYLSGTAAPTTGNWKKGDFVRNSSPSELGTGGSKYTIAGWRCTVSGTPGTWVQARELTGN